MVAGIVNKIPLDKLVRTRGCSYKDEEEEAKIIKNEK